MPLIIDIALGVILASLVLSAIQWLRQRRTTLRYLRGRPTLMWDLERHSAKKAQARYGARAANATAGHAPGSVATGAQRAKE
jgi:hypothetical protein